MNNQINRYIDYIDYSKSIYALKRVVDFFFHSNAVV